MVFGRKGIAANPDVSGYEPDYRLAINLIPEFDPTAYAPRASNSEEQDRLSFLLRHEDPTVGQEMLRRSQSALDRHGTAHKALCDKIDAALAAGGSKWHIQHYAILGTSIWDGGHFGLLHYALDLLPVDGWNMMFMAPNPVASVDMRIPYAPDGEVEKIRMEADLLLQKIDAEWAAVFQVAKTTQDIAQLAETADHQRQQIINFASEARAEIIRAHSTVG